MKASTVVIAAAAVVGGYLLWKRMQPAPTQPTTLDKIATLETATGSLLTSIKSLWSSPSSTTTTTSTAASSSTSVLAGSAYDSRVETRNTISSMEESIA